MNKPSFFQILKRVAQQSNAVSTVLGLMLCGATFGAHAHGGSSLIFKGSDGGIVHAIVATPKPPYILYAATSQAGVFASKDNGNHWVAMNHGLASMDVLTLALDPAATRTLYAGTRDGLFKSTDGGDTWTATGTGLAHEQIKVLALAAQPNTLYAGTYHGVWKSTDGGASWSPLAHQPAATDINVLIIAADSTHSMYVGTAQGLYRSRDAGSTWQRLSKGMTVPGIVSLTLDSQRSGVLYAGCADGAYESQDGGDSWRAITFKQTNLPVTALLPDPRHAGTIYLGTSFVGGLFKTTDDGKTWLRIRGEDFTPSITTLMFLPDDNTSLLAGTSFQSEIFQSHDAGLSWQDTPGKAALPHLVSLSSSDHGASMYIAAQDSVYQFTAPSGPWLPLAKPGIGMLHRVIYSAVPTPALWACGEGGVAVAQRVNGAWQFQRVPRLGKSCVDVAVSKSTGKVLVANTTSLWQGPSPWRQRQVPHLGESIEHVAWADTDDTAYVLTYHGLWTAPNSAADWRRIGTGTNKIFTDMAVLGLDKPTLWLASDSDISRDTTNGTWENDSQGIFPPGIAIITATADGKTAYAASLTQGRIFKRDHAQSAWHSSDIEEGLLQITDVLIDPAHENVVYTATRDSGLYRSDDAGEHWSAVNSGLPADSSVAEVAAPEAAHAQR